MGRKKNPTPPNTDIPFKEYEKLATDLYFNKGKKPAEIKALLGNPHWEGKDWFIEFRKTTPDKLIRTEAHKKENQLTVRKKRSQFVDDEIEAWAKRLDKENKWPKGKSLEGFIAAEKRLQTLYDKEIDRLKSLGLDVSDGHIIALANENIKGTPLDAKGKGGSHSPRSRVPEMLAENKSRGAKYDIPKLEARKAGIPTTSAEAFAQYLTGDTGTGVHLGTKDKQRIHIQGENPDAIIAEKHKFVEGKKIEAADKKYQQSVAMADSYKLETDLKNNGNRFNGNGNGINGNGKNGFNGNGTNKVNGKVDIPKKGTIAGAVTGVLSNKGVKRALKFVPVVSAGAVLMSAKTYAAEAEADPTWQNKAQSILANVDVGLEGVELATGGVAGLVTTPLQIGLMFADQMIHQTEDSFQRSETDWDARRAARRGQR